MRYSLLLLTFFLTGCANQEEDASTETGPEINRTEQDPALLGAWLNEQDSSGLIFTENKTYEIYIKKQVNPILYGDYRISDDTIWMINDPESKICLNMKGVHRYAVEEEQLIFSTVRDSCIARINYLETDWKRDEKN